MQFERDGLYFLHKEGHYLLGQSPLALIWKDASCCRFLLDTDLNGKPLQCQVLVWLHTVAIALQGLALGMLASHASLVLAAPRTGCFATQCGFQFVALAWNVALDSHSGRLGQVRAEGHIHDLSAPWCARRGHGSTSQCHMCCTACQG